MFTINKQSMGCDTELAQTEGENAWRGNVQGDFLREKCSAGEECVTGKCLG